MSLYTAAAANATSAGAASGRLAAGPSTYSHAAEHCQSAVWRTWGEDLLAPLAASGRRRQAAGPRARIAAV